MPAPVEVGSDGPLTAAGGLPLDADLLRQTGAALASQHSKLMADTDVFGLYQDDPGSAAAAAGAVPSGSARPAPVMRMPAPFTHPFEAFSGQVLPQVLPPEGRASGPF